MNDAVAVMLKNYGQIRDTQDELNALKEIIQQIALLGLHRGGFFKLANFYGGTALRLLYGLDRFSEDMDFCLTVRDPDFTFQPYLQPIADELERYGFNARVEEKRTEPNAAIGSAFVKQNTLRGLLVIDKNDRKLPKGHLLKVNLEVHKQNPPGSHRVTKLIKLPVPFLVGTLSESSLFAGKLHALIARSYLNRVKGRDYYDFIFYNARSTPVNITYLDAKLRGSGHYTETPMLSRDKLVALLQEKFATVDFAKAKSDVLPFISKEKVRDLDGWGPELFSAMAAELVAEGVSEIPTDASS